MRGRSSGLGLLVGALLCSVAVGAEAPNSSNPPNVIMEKGTVSGGDAGPVILLRQATQLVEYARDNESPVAMLTAVQMLRRIHVEEGADRIGPKLVETVGDRQSRPNEDGVKGSAPAPTLDIKQLLEEAKPWAEDKPHVLALLEEEASRTARAGGGTLGRTSGVMFHLDMVTGKGADTYQLTFRGKEMAGIAVVGDGDTDLDLLVFDEAGHLVAKDTDPTDKCLVLWMPRSTGRFQVRIENHGQLQNRYLLMTN